MSNMNWVVSYVVVMRRTEPSILVKLAETCIPEAGNIYKNTGARRAAKTAL